MACCRSRTGIRVPSPAVTRPSGQSLDSLRLCNRLSMERDRLMVTLHDGRAFVENDGASTDLAQLLALTSECSPAVAAIVRELSAIYTAALSGGTITRIQNAHGAARVSLNFIRQYR